MARRRELLFGVAAGDLRGPRDLLGFVEGSAQPLELVLEFFDPQSTIPGVAGQDHGGPARGQPLLELEPQGPLGVLALFGGAPLPIASLG